MRATGLICGWLVFAMVACASEPGTPTPASGTPSTTVGAGGAETSSATTGELSAGGTSSSSASFGGAGGSSSPGGTPTTVVTSGTPTTTMGGSTSSGTSTTGTLAAGGSGVGGESTQGGTGPLATGGAGGASGAGGAGGSGGVGGTGSVDQDSLPPVTLHLAGDSTVMTYEAGSAQEGWGQELGQFFIDKVSINNQAIGGASVRTFQSGRWTNIMGALVEGDYVMIQFGTNDSGTVAGRHVEVPDFSVALGEMIDDVESRQATAILVTPSALQEWSGGMEGNTRLGPYADAMRELGPERGVLVDDLNARSVEFLNMIGQTAAQEIYIDGDKAHFTQAGATQMAEFVAEELRRIVSPLADYLN